MATKTALTPNDVLNLPALSPTQGHHYELSEGELILVGFAGVDHEWVKSTVLSLLVPYVVKSRTGRVFAESLFALGDETARQPDVAFVGRPKLDSLTSREGVFPFAPDIAVEVVSKSETLRGAERKVKEYLGAGVAEVWQINPELKIVVVRTASGNRELTNADVLETPVLPGFSVTVAELFA